MKFQIGQDVVLPDGSLGKVEKIDELAICKYYVSGEWFREIYLEPYQFKKGDRVVSPLHYCTLTDKKEYVVSNVWNDTDGKTYLSFLNDENNTDESDINSYRASSFRLAPSEPEKWEPKHLEEVEWEKENGKKRVIATNKYYAWIDRFDEIPFTVKLSEIRPIPSLQDKVIEILEELDPPLVDYKVIADRIIALIANK